MKHKKTKTRVKPINYDDCSVWMALHYQGKPFVKQERRYFLGIFPYWKDIELLDQKPD